MSLVPATGNISYGTVVFGPMTETVDIQCVPYYDRAARAVAYHIYGITIRSTITNDGDNTDATMEAIRQQLLAPAQEFHYEDKGFGDLIINLPGGGGARDVVWGPKPRLLRWKPKGDDKASEIVWRVDVAIPVCAYGTERYKFSLMEFNYRASYSTDASGYNTRRISGYLKIPQTRRRFDDKGMTDMVDRYWDAIQPRMIDGYRRTIRDRDISDDKCQLNFTIIDEEMPPNVPPPGIVHARASQQIQNAEKFVVGINNSPWVGILTAEYEVAKDHPKSRAYAAFMRLLRDRTMATRLANRGGPGLGETTFRLIKFHMAEPEIYGKSTASFMAAYHFLMHPSRLLGSSGLWQPALDSNWDLWRRSLEGSALHHRGNYKIGLTDLDADAIIDLCIKDNVRNFRVDDFLPRVRDERADLAPVNTLPPEGDSWIDYKAELRTEIIDSTIELKPIPKDEIVPRPRSTTLKATPISRVLSRDPYSARSPSGRSEGGLVSTGHPDPNVERYRGTSAGKKEAEGVPHHLTAPRMYVHFWGHALRAGYSIPTPQLLEIGGHRLTAANPPGSGSGESVVQNWLGLPIYRREWYQRYLVTKLPDGGAVVNGILG